MTGHPGGLREEDHDGRLYKNRSGFMLKNNDFVGNLR
jgi:hypothetical protein